MDEQGAVVLALPGGQRVRIGCEAFGQHRAISDGAHGAALHTRGERFAYVAEHSTEVLSRILVDERGNEHFIFTDSSQLSYLPVVRLGAGAAGMWCSSNAADATAR